ncbi:MAG: hypothetical protein K2K16_00250 [Ruminococcus sp.]|nr:hypothetical protein [Ruminococcus sp.]
MNEIYEIILSDIKQPLWSNWYIKKISVMDPSARFTELKPKDLTVQTYQPLK